MGGRSDGPCFRQSPRRKSAFAASRRSPAIPSPSPQGRSLIGSLLLWPVALTMGLCFAAMTSPVLADVLEQRVIYDQDPWDPENRLEVGDCQKGTDGSITCDTRPQGQVWVETLVNGNNN